MAELLGEGFVEIRPRLDAFKAELNKNARKSIKDNIEDPANEAEAAVEDLVKAAKKLGGVDIGEGFDQAAEGLSDAVKAANKLADVDIADNARRAVLEARLLEKAQENAREAAEDFAGSEKEVQAAVKKATAETKKLIKEIDSSADGAQDFETAMLAAVKNISKADVEAEGLDTAIGDAANEADDLASNLTRVARTIPDEEADRMRDALSDRDIQSNLRQASAAADDIADGVRESADENKKFLDRIRDTKDEARDLQRRMDRVADETDRVGDEAKQAENRIEGAKKETREWGGAARGVRTAIAGIVAGLGAREIVQGLRQATESAIDFQGGLNEVFTLIPGADDLLRETLGEGVREVAREFGQLPEDAIPALYNALSAGVPPDNVLAFLETASKLAVGGVTDLNSGVNILTTAVNAYSAVVDENGVALLDANLASDILFTTVRLGKTTIDELNASLGQVLPTAAATGLGFEDVGAALAVLTANGLNTPRATTALNASLVELNKAGTKSFELFSQTAGQTFPEFIAAGGNLAEGLRILSEGADATGVSILDIVPVEAARGVLALTNNIDALDAATAEFQDTAGASEGAFTEIFEGDAFAVQQATAAFEDLKIEIGNALLPTVAAVARQFTDLYKGFLEGGVEGFTDRLREIAPATAGIIDTLSDVIGAVSGFFAFLRDGDSTIEGLTGLVTLSAFAERFGIDIRDARERLEGFRETILDLFNIEPGEGLLSGIFGDGFSAVDAVIATIVAGAGLIGAAIVAFVGPAVLGAFGSVFALIGAPFTAAIGGIGLAAGGLGSVLAGAFGGISGIIGTIVSSFGALTTTLGSKGIFGTLRTLIPSFGTLGRVLLTVVKFINPVALIGGLLVAAFVKLIATNAEFRESLANLLPPLIEIGKSIVEQVVPVVQQLADVFLNELVPAFEPVVEVIVTTLLPAIIQLVGSIVDNLLPVFLDLVLFLAADVLPVVARIAAAILTTLVPALAAIIVWVADNVIPALVELVGWFTDNVVPIIIEVAGWIEDTLIPALGDFAGFIVDDVVPALADLWGWFADNILPVLAEVGEFILTTLLPAFGGFVAFVVTNLIPVLADIFTWFVDNILPVLIEVAEFIGGTLGLIFEGFGLILTEIVIPAISAVWSFFSEQLLPILGDVATFVGDTLGLIWEGFGLILTEVVVPAVTTVYDFFKDSILPIITEVAGFVKDTLGLAWEGLATILDGVVLPALDALWSFIDGSLNVVLGILGGIIDGIKAGFDVLGPAIETAATAPFRALWALLKVLLYPVFLLIDEGIVDLESGLGFLKTAIDLGKDAFDAFKNTVQRVLDTISDLIGKVTDLKNLNPAGFLGDIAGGVGGFFGGLPGLAEGGIVTNATAAIVGEDGPEVIVPLSAARRDRLFELARASGLDQIIAGNLPEIQNLPASPSSAEFQGLSRAIDATTPTVTATPSASAAPGGTIEQAQQIRNFYIEASGVTIEEVINESEARADAELRAESVGI